MANEVANNEEHRVQISQKELDVLWDSKRELNNYKKNTALNVAVQKTQRGMSVVPQNIAEVMRFAEVMASGQNAIPAHLRGNVGGCLAVAMQAFEWNMNPFSVAQKTYCAGKADAPLAFEAQLIMAVVNTRAPLDKRLRFVYGMATGKNTDQNAYGKSNIGAANESDMNMTCTVIGVIDGDEYSLTTPRIGNISPRNSPLWKSDPQQQLSYYAARAWARRYVPEVIMGVYDREEIQEIAQAEEASSAPRKNPLEITVEEINEDEQNSAKIAPPKNDAADESPQLSFPVNASGAEIHPPRSLAAKSFPTENMIIYAESILDVLNSTDSLDDQSKEIERLSANLNDIAKTKKEREFIATIANYARRAINGEINIVDAEKVIRAKMS